MKLTALTPHHICRAIQSACEVTNESERENDGCWSFRCALESDLNAARQDKIVMNGGKEDTLLYGLVVVRRNANNGCDGVEDGTYPSILATFYLAYSTWDGRVLFLDQITPLHGFVTSQDESDRLQHLIRRSLARVAVQLDCSRFTWQQFGEPKVSSAASADLPTPEHLKGWLTLHWDCSSMKQFLGMNDSPTPPNRDDFDHSTTSGTKDLIAKALNSLTNYASSFRLRLASESDVDIIGRLVQGLADFEKEPDAVNVTTDQYKLDGFEGQPPLFYCIFMEHVGEDDKPSDETKNDRGDGYVCGMALCTLEEKLDGGRFLYLEDLFIEKPYRGNGAGSLVMRALATIAVSLKCSRMAWQALHWNTPALTFYGKLGAKVQEGLETLRYTGETLVNFAG